MTKHDLEKMTVLKLREEATKFPDLKSTHSMHKEELIPVLMEHMGIKEELPKTISRIKKKVKKNKQELKKTISELKGKREEALQAKDAKSLKNVRNKIKKIKRNLKKLAA